MTDLTLKLCYFFILNMSTIRLTTSCELAVDLFFFGVLGEWGAQASMSPSLLNFFLCRFVLGDD